MSCVIQNIQEKKKADAKGDWGGINKFLNRLLAVSVARQAKIFQYFMALLVRSRGLLLRHGVPCPCPSGLHA